MVLMGEENHTKDGIEIGLYMIISGFLPKLILAESLIIKLLKASNE